MTRKQALDKAIEIISKTKHKEQKEVCKILADIMNELPLNKWTKDSIVDAYRQFYIDNGRLPTIHDTIDDKNIPVIKHLRNKFNMNLTQFYNCYFPDILEEKNNKNKNILADFVDQYTSLKSPTRKQYDTLRKPGSVSSHSVIRISGEKNWLSLLKKYNLLSNLENRNHYNIKVNVIRPQYSSDKERIARYDEIISKIDEIIISHDRRIERERRR